MHPFEPGKSGNPNGRPRKVFSSIAEECQNAGFELVTPANVRELFEYMLALPLCEIKRLADDPENPALIRIVSKELQGPRAWQMLIEMLDRAHGKPKQAVDLVPDGGKVYDFTGYGLFKLLAGDQAPEETGPPK